MKEQQQNSLPNSLNFSQEEYEDLVRKVTNFVGSFKQYFDEETINYEVVDTIIRCLPKWEARNGAQFSTMVCIATKNRLLNLKKSSRNRSTI